MGAAGQRREQELLAQIAALEKTIRERDNQIGDFEQQVAALREQIKMKEDDIQQHLKTIADLEAKIANLEDKLANAMQSGDEATQALRKKLQDAEDSLA